MKSALRIVVLLALSGALAYPGTPPADITGTWSVSMTAVFPDQTTCQYSGSAEISQDGPTINGTVVQNRVSGPADICPPTMNADLSGTIDGDSVIGTLDGGQSFGMASFTGTIGPGGSSLSGTFETGFDMQPGLLSLILPAGITEPFPGVTGTFNGDRVDTAAIPALNLWGLALLTTGLLAASLLLLRRAAK